MIKSYEVLKAAENAKRAIRRGDVGAAERWLRVAERAALLTKHLAAVALAEARAERQKRNPV